MRRPICRPGASEPRRGQPVTPTIACTPATSATSALAPAVAQPSVAPSTPLSTPPASIVDQLLREGKEFRERGDTTNALARFQEALDSEPDNTGVLQETAQTYESMQMFDRANDVWRRIKQISPSDSATYALADRRLKVGVPALPTVEPGGTAAETDVTSSKDVGGNTEGPVMGFRRQNQGNVRSGSRNESDIGDRDKKATRRRYRP